MIFKFKWYHCRVLSTGRTPITNPGMCSSLIMEPELRERRTSSEKKIDTKSSPEATLDVPNIQSKTSGLMGSQKRGISYSEIAKKRSLNTQTAITVTNNNNEMTSTNVADTKGDKEISVDSKYVIEDKDSLSMMDITSVNTIPDESIVAINKSHGVNICSDKEEEETMTLHKNELIKPLESRIGGKRELRLGNDQTNDGKYSNNSLKQKLPLNLPKMGDEVDKVEPYYGTKMLSEDIDNEGSTPKNKDLRISGTCGIAFPYMQVRFCLSSSSIFV